MQTHPVLAALADRVAARRERGLARRLVSVGSTAGVRATVDGRPVVLMASNDYLGLANHPRLAEAALEATLTCGAGAGASRLITGTLDCHLDLEARIAAFKETEAALMFSTGYQTNLGVVSALARPGDLIVSDRLNHASLIDACRLSRASVAIYPHKDAAAAEAALAAAPAGALKFIITDGVFSMDGDIAPLPELLAAARRHQALLVVDDAHATGVWGPRGRGSLDHFGLTPSPDVVMIGTFSKALGGLGGFAAGACEVIEALVNSARSFLYTTAPPPAQAAVAAAALELVDAEPQRRVRLWELSSLMRERLARAGLTVLSEQGPIIPILVGEAQKAVDLAAALLAAGVLIPAVRPPTVPEGTSRLRVALSAAHTDEDVETAADALVRAVREAGL